MAPGVGAAVNAAPRAAIPGANVKGMTPLTGSRV